MYKAVFLNEVLVETGCKQNGIESTTAGRQDSASGSSVVEEEKEAESLHKILTSYSNMAMPSDRVQVPNQWSVRGHPLITSHIKGGGEGQHCVTRGEGP